MTVQMLENMDGGSAGQLHLSGICEQPFFFWHWL